MSKERFGFGLLLAAALSVFAAGCGVFESEGGGGGDESRSEDSEVLRDYLAGGISTLDTAQATDGYSFNVINNFVEGLYRLDGDEEPVPGVAESVETSEDGLSYTISSRRSASDAGAARKAPSSAGSGVANRERMRFAIRAVEPMRGIQHGFM